MFQPFIYMSIVTQELSFDIFEKYRTGTHGQDLPFRLYSIQEQTYPVNIPRRGNPRGPYRRYSRGEK